MIYPVILSGGSGPRPWPMSRSLYPKQLLALFGQSSLLQQTVLRVEGIPLGTAHRLENPGKIPLHLIDVQSGSYLGEDDIIGFDDAYDRT